MVPRARVLYIAHYCRPRDAAWISTFYLLKALKSTGLVKRALVITNDPGATQLKDVRELKPWTSIKYAPFSSILEMKRLGKLLRATLAYFLIFLIALKTIKEERITHIFTQHHNYHMASFTGALMARLLGRACIIKVQDGVPYIGRSPVEAVMNRSIMALVNKLAFKWASSILNKSSERAFLISRAFRIPKNKMLIIPNLVDLSTFSKPNEVFRREFKKRYGLEGHKILLFIGSTLGRGLEKLLRALPKIISRIGKVKLVILGEAGNKKALMKLATSLGIGDCVVFAGAIEHELVSSIISLADLCVGPLVVGWFSIADVQRKILEYMACGKPFVAAKWAVTKDLLVDGKTGIAISDPDDIDELAEKITDILADDERRRGLGENARKVIEALYDCNSPEVVSRLRRVLSSSMEMVCWPGGKPLIYRNPSFGRDGRGQADTAR